MSFYGKDITIDGVVCGILTRGAANGEYVAVFEREHASLEQIEGINWACPAVRCKRACDAILPDGYGFELRSITYDSSVRAYTVTIRTAFQYLGDVTGYQSQIDALTAGNEAQRETIAGLERQLDEADEAAIALYEALLSAGEQEAETPVSPDRENGTESEEQAPAGGEPGGAGKEDAE